MARSPVLAAGGIVLRQGRTPLVAVVRLRKRNEWVLPKGKLNDGETPRAAAEREVVEETGHDVAVHEFLGTLVYESRSGSKVVHYWRMEARGGAVHELMRDVRAVDWLPLDAAIERLSRDHERAFLENVGPIALSAASHAATARKARAKQPEKRRTRQPDAAEAPAATAASAPSLPAQPLPQVAQHDDGPVVIDATACTSVDQAADQAQRHGPPSFAPEIEPVVVEPGKARTRWQPRSFIQKLHDWLRRDT
ncbi:NUDIX hydrolase [Bradyrhizobium roseum]|uniref:NUDIX hydrolase n=1 Tax=Bradyrhizobium roseum TaxID=3056648 RepID=UPI0026276F67|nr:NUDIX hydrolase [Bradyrhizobium roseus]